MLHRLTFLSFILLKLLNHKYVSVVFLVPLQSSTQLTIDLYKYIYQHIEFLFCICNFSQYLFDKSLPQIHPTLTILSLCKVCILYNFCWLCWQFLLSMLTLCSTLLPPYRYSAQNYASLIGSSLLGWTHSSSIIKTVWVISIMLVICHARN